MTDNTDERRGKDIVERLNEHLVWPVLDAVKVGIMPGVWIERLILDRIEAAAEIERLRAERDRLRGAMDKLARLGNGDSYGNSEGNRIAIAALAQEVEAALAQTEGKP